MKKTAYTISILRANLFGLFWLFPVLLVYQSIYIAIWGFQPFIRVLIQLPQHLLVFLIVFTLGVVLHEWLHGISIQIIAKLPSKAIQYGVQWKTVTPYAHCKVPLDISVYRTATLIPVVTLGLLPALIALATGNPWLLFFGIIFTWAAGGDILILWLLRNVKPGAKVEDHPSEAGCNIFY